MKILLYQEKIELFDKSGIGRAMRHQVKALEAAGIDFTLNPKDDYDIVHLNTIDLSSWKIAKRARKAGKKIVFHAHSTKEDFRNSFIFSNQIAPLFKWYIKKTYRLGDILITPTPYSKRLLDGYKLKKDIYALSNGIDLMRFNHTSDDKIKTFRTYFNLDHHQKVVMSVGLYFARKGLHDFIEIAKTRPEYTFIWFGHTPKKYMTQKIKKAIKNKPNNVILPGYIKGDIIEGAYASADVFFFPTYEETEGIVVLEALASKCPVVIRDIPVYEDWLENGVNCFKANDNHRFANIIDGIMTKTIQDTKEAGYVVAQSKSIEQIGLELKKIYETLL